MGDSSPARARFDTRTSSDTPFTESVAGLNNRAGCAPTFIRNFSVFSNLYLHQKRKVHGSPSNENRNCGSKLSLLPIDISNITAGLPKEKLGSNEIPLLVTLTALEK